MVLKLPQLRLPGWARTLAKLLILAAIIFLIVRKIDERVLVQAIAASDPLWIGWAILWYAISKGVAAWRFNTLMGSEGIRMTERANLRLYWLCMYYNLLLPGGISGDGYKIKVLHDAFGRPMKRLLALTLLDRVAGVIALGQLGLLLGIWIPGLRAYGPWAIPAIGASLAGSYWLFRKSGGDVPGTWRLVSLQSIAVQGAQLLATWGLVMALGVGDHWAGYLILFLVSSVVAMLPITVGGAGARELTFLYGSQYLGIHAEQAVAIGFLFYLIATAVAFSGILFSFGKLPLAGSATGLGHKEAGAAGEG